MRPASRTQIKKNFKSTLCKCHQEVTDLKKLMSGIKDLQNKVSHMPIYLQLTKSNHSTPLTPKIKQKCSSSKSKYSQNIVTKGEQRDKSIKTIRKVDVYSNYDSVMLTNDRKTLNLTLKNRQALIGPSRDTYYFQSVREPDLMSNYVSLQFQNMKLEKDNLKLQKQLVEQSLRMERREKQLLKNKLKRIKTHQTQKNSLKRSHKQVQTPVISSFNTSPIKIKIPELIQEKDQNRGKKERHRKQQDHKKQRSGDSLLLSDDNQHFSPDKKNQCRKGKLQNQYWKLIEKKQNHDRGQLRETLGDIANKIKEVRKK